MVFRDKVPEMRMVFRDKVPQVRYSVIRSLK